MKFKKTLLGSNLWASLERRIAALPDKQSRGDAFEEFCEVYLRLVPKYNIKHVWSKGEYPKWVIHQLQLTGQKDQGIDRIAQTRDQELWAIQAKFRSDRNDVVSYDELATFLAISDKADYRVIISNVRRQSVSDRACHTLRDAFWDSQVVKLVLFVKLWFEIV